MPLGHRSSFTLIVPHPENQIVSHQSTTLSQHAITERAREIARLLATVQVRGFLAYKFLPLNYSDEIELGLLLNQRVNSSPVTPKDSDATKQ